MIAREVARRRTFAIISHPDAGKTTLTEKLLLFSGAIHIAGTVKARKSARHATSDWMEIEKQRGISVASSVMQMEYRGCVINLLDTPGHQDFSEDTYRVLTAVDAALMVIDAGKGIEPQTRRLLQVCRQRNTPIMTFINKMDRDVRPPLELIDEIESFIGRLPVTSAVHQLSRDDLITILTEPRNAIIKQFQRLFGFDGIELVFSTDALKAVADKALERETGARGLRSIIEEVLLEVQFELPSRRDVKKCVVTKDTIERGIRPTLVTEAAKDEPEDRIVDQAG